MVCLVIAFVIPAVGCATFAPPALIKASTSSISADVSHLSVQHTRKASQYDGHDKAANQ
jgi:hypothetical protein